MAKQSGLGDNLFIDGYDLSGDAGSLGRIGGGPEPIPVTGINKSAPERLGGVRSGEISWVSYFNPTAAAAHPVLGALPRGDVQVTYLRGTTLGNPAASLVSKQIDYPGNRESNGAFTFAVQALSNAWGLVWGEQLTAGRRVDTVATNGTSLDGTAATSFGWQAYLHVMAFTGTSVTVTIQDSADNSAWATLTGATFTAATAIGAQRIAASTGTATVRRYVRVITTGTFSSADFAVNFARHSSIVTDF
jgi:hypothetical protein